MKYDLENKKVMITGASGGIGKELSKKFLENGCNIIFTSSSLEKTENLKKLYGENHHYYTLNLLDKNSIFSNIKSISEDHRDIEILINNAGLTDDNLFFLQP